MNATTKTALILALALASASVEARPPPRPLYPEHAQPMPKPVVYVWACKLGYMPACRRVREP